MHFLFIFIIIISQVDRHETALYIASALMNIHIFFYHMPVLKSDIHESRQIRKVSVRFSFRSEITVITEKQWTKPLI